MKTTDHYSVCLGAIDDYLKEQWAKGLVDWTSSAMLRTLRFYRTHIGTHQEVIFPEIERLAAQHGWTVQAIIGFKRQENGSWTVLTGESRPENKDVYVQIELEFWSVPKRGLSKR